MKLLLATLLGGLAIFFWGFLSWSVLPWHMSQYKNFNNEPAVRSAFDSQPELGVYRLPGTLNLDGSPRSSEETMKAAMETTEAIALVRPGPSARGMASYMGWGLVVCFAQALILVMILNRIPLGFRCRVITSVMIGLFTGVASQGLNCNWFDFPIAFCLPYIADHLIQGLLAGIIIAKFVQKPGDRCR